MILNSKSGMSKALERGCAPLSAREKAIRTIAKKEGKEKR